jgi:SPP1 family predicted phage head-tail adaptor
MAKATTSDGQGGFVTGTPTSASVFAEVMPVSGKEIYRAQHLNVTANYTILVRYNPAITAEKYIVWNGISMQVRYVENIENRNMWMMLYCESGVAI